MPKSGMVTHMSPRVAMVAGNVRESQDVQSFSTGFFAAISGCSAWSAEARQVIALAAQLHVALDEHLLTLLDVHDLQALRVELAERLRHAKAA